MGRRQFESVVAQAARVQLKEKIMTIPGQQVPAANYLAFDLYSTPGTKGKLVNIYFYAQGITNSTVPSTSGTHKVELYNISAAGSDRPIYIFAQNIHSAGVMLKYNTINVAADGFKYPVSESAQLDQIKSVRFDSTLGLRINYFNNTDKAQSNDVKLVVVYEEEEVR